MKTCGIWLTVRFLRINKNVLQADVAVDIFTLDSTEDSGARMI